MSDRPRKLSTGEWTALIMRVVRELGQEHYPDESPLEQLERGREIAEGVMIRALGEERALALIEKQEGPRLSKDDNRAIVKELSEVAPGADRDAKIQWAIRVGADVFDSSERFLELLAYVRNRVEAHEEAGGTIDHMPPEPEPVNEFRSDLATIGAEGGVVKFWTRNVQAATSSDGKNKDGGYEWIVARINGTGFNRLLIMVMGGSRPPSRIYIQIGSHSEFRNSVFPVPLMDTALWRVEGKGDGLKVFLNGELIYSRSGGFHVRSATMNGYANRHMAGEWAEYEGEKFVEDPEATQVTEGTDAEPEAERKPIFQWNGTNEIRLNPSLKAERLYIVKHTGPDGKKYPWQGPNAQYHELLETHRPVPADGIIRVRNPAAIAREGVVQMCHDNASMRPISMCWLIRPRVPAVSYITEAEWRAGKTDGIILPFGRDG